MKKAISKKSVLTKLFVSYILISIIPMILLGIFSYSKISEIVKEHSGQIFSASLSKTAENLESKMNSTFVFASNIAEINWVKLVTRSIENSDYYELRKYANQLLNFKLASGFIDEIILYVKDKDLIVSSFGVDDSKDYFNNVVEIEGLDDTEIEGILSRNVSSELFDNVKVGFFGVNKKKGLLYKTTLPIGAGAYSKTVLIVFIDEKQIHNIIEYSATDPEIGVYLINDQNSLISSVNIDESVYDKLIEYKINNENGLNEGNFIENDKQYYIYQYNLSKLKWKLYLVIPEKFVTANISSRSILLMMLMFLLIIAGIVLSYIFAVSNFKPVRNLVKIMRDLLPSNVKNYNEMDENEYKWLEGRINLLIEEENNLKKKIKTNLPVLQNAYFRKVLNDYTETISDVDRVLMLLQMEFKYTFFACCMVVSKTKTVNTNKVQIVNIFTEIAKKFNIDIWCVRMQDKRKIAIILNFENKNNFEHYIKEIEEKYDEGVDEFVISVGGIYSGFNNLRQSFLEAGYILDLRAAGSYKSVLSYVDVKDNEKLKYYYPTDKENGILNCIKAGKYEYAVQILKETSEFNLQKNIPTIEMKNFFIRAIMTAVRAIDEIGLYYKYGFNPEKIYTIESFEEMHEYVKNIYHNICTIINENSSRKILDTAKEIIRFVDNNITEPDMSLGFVSEKFNITIPYLSKMFKDEIGSNFLDYVNKKRIEKAKKLMVNNELKIKDIYKMLGFDNGVTFRRLFKKYNGVTPLEYKKILETKNDQD